MLRTLGKKITNNFGLKLLSAVCAFVLWIVVINIDNPVVVQTFTTSVTAENTDYLSGQNKYFEVLNGKNTVTFNVSGERSILNEMENADFAATADMEKIEYSEDGICRVPVSITPTRYSNKVTVTSKKLYLEVVLEDLGTCQKVITASTKGAVADGCALGNIEIVGSNLLKISGPSSIVGTVDSVTATINVEGVSADVTDSVVPVLFDDAGNVVDTTKLKMSLSTVTVSAEVLSTKDVALEFDTVGRTAEGYMVTGIECQLDTVRIKGESGILNTVNKITVPAEVLDVTDVEKDLKVTVDISSYLPEGTALVLASDARIEVTVKVEEVLSKKFQVPVKNITVTNLREGYLLEFDENTVEVSVGGPKSIVSEMKTKQITGTLDAGGVGLGSHQFTINISLKENCRVLETVRTPVVITADESIITQTEPNQTEQGLTEPNQTDTAEDVTPSEGNPEDAITEPLPSETTTDAEDMTPSEENPDDASAEPTSSETTTE